MRAGVRAVGWGVMMMMMMMMMMIMVIVMMMLLLLALLAACLPHCIARLDAVVAPSAMD